MENVDERAATGLGSIMKRQVILCGVAVTTALSICLAAPTPARQAKSRKREATVVNMEKIVTEAFKNKQVETFRKYLAPEFVGRSEEHTSELQSQSNLVCRLLLEKKKQ